MGLIKKVSGEVFAADIGETGRCAHFLPPLDDDGTLRTSFEPEKWAHYAVCETTGTYSYVLNLPEAGERHIGGLQCKHPRPLPKNGKFDADYVEQQLTSDGLYQQTRALYQREMTML